jgi:SNF2 family DNA or RNA helicase
VEFVGSEIKMYRELSKRLGLPFPLRDYQWEGVSFLAQNEAVLLADEMGLGKTVQTAVALQVLLNSPNCDRALIVTPASLCLNWERELAKWAPSLYCRRVLGSKEDRLVFYRLPIPILIASYEQIRADAGSLHPCVHFDVVVLDEAQRIKNSSSSTFLSCKLLPRKYAWSLTGTPVENKAEDLISIMSFVEPGLIYKGLPLIEIHKRIGKTFLRRVKERVLEELPPIISQDLPLELTGPQKEAYDYVWNDRRNLIHTDRGRITEVNLLAVITKLKKICNFDDSSGESVKLDMLNVILESLVRPNNKCIIFSQYVETLKWLSTRIDSLPLDLYHGKMTNEDRDTVIGRFENTPGPRALLISLKAGGVGLNLQSASTVILFDRWWNPAVEDQAVQRAHRFGRKTPLHVCRFLITNSIEEKINEILKDKKILFEKYIGQAENAETKLFSKKELARILNLNV